MTYRFLGHFNRGDRERLLAAIEEVPTEVRALWPQSDDPKERAEFVSAASKAWKQAKAQHTGDGRPAAPIELQALNTWTSMGEPVMSKPTTTTRKSGSTTGRTFTVRPRIEDDELVRRMAEVFAERPDATLTFVRRALNEDNIAVSVGRMQPLAAQAQKQAKSATPRKATPTKATPKATAPKATTAKKPTAKKPAAKATAKKPAASRGARGRAA